MCLPVLPVGEQVSDRVYYKSQIVRVQNKCKRKEPKVEELEHDYMRDVVVVVPQQVEDDTTNLKLTLYAQKYESREI
jgi:hypothetical protein